MLLPDNAGLSFLKGAVIFGHNRKDIMHKNEPIYVWARNIDYDPEIHPKKL